jgi:hypothetical protein
MKNARTLVSDLRRRRHFHAVLTVWHRPIFQTPHKKSTESSGSETPRRAACLSKFLDTTGAFRQDYKDLTTITDAFSVNPITNR